MTGPEPTASERDRLRHAVHAQPQDFIAWVMLADAELDHGDAEAGLRAAQRALNLRPRHPEALARLGRSHWLSGRHVQAAQALSEAVAQAPRHPGITLWLGHALEDAGEAEAAAQAYEHAYRLAPGEPIFAAHLLNGRRKLCDWRDIDTLSTQVRRAVREGHGAVEPFAFLSEDASADEQLGCARQRAQALAAVVRPMPPPARVPDDAPLRLGFLSNGFGAHPTGLLTVAFFEALQAQETLSAHLFALTPDDGSPIRRRLASATQLHDVAGQSHAHIAQAIRDQRIDVLYDLRGWGGGGTPEVLAMRPAPVQVNWLAYPGTSGAPWIDYALADRFALPASLAPSYSECVAYLPGAFQPSDTRRTIGTPPAREACGLPATGVVFACFNNSYKLNPRSVSRMLDVLTNVDGSVLWLLSGPGRADERLRVAAQAQGVDPARLVFMRKLPHADYLARYRHVDLFLDTHPYNAHTTASDALWAGCPVLTCPGATFAARVAGSLNHHLGLDDMNVADDAAFVATAIRLGRDAAARADLCSRLQAAIADAPLFDMPRFAQGFADVARRMADRHRKGLPPAPLDEPRLRYPAGMSHADALIPLHLCVLTVSDSRTLAEDRSGDYLIDALTQEGHRLHERALLPDDRYRLRAQVSQWIADPAVDGILVTGGTGFTGRDSTPEALLPLLDKEMPGFGELFRHVSVEEIGTSSLQSRAFAGLANQTFIFCLPGSTSACRTAWEKIIRAQLDARTRPCNLATLRPRLKE